MYINCQNLNLKYVHRLLIVLTFFFVVSSLSAEERIKLKYTGIPLSTILDRIRSQEQISLSFSYNELNKYIITVDSTFSNGADALRHLIKSLPLKLTVIDNVYVISRMPDLFLVNGMVSDADTGERLPFTSFVYNKRVYYSDENGLFRIPGTDAMNVSISVYYLGYKSLDTIATSEKFNYIEMKPVDINLKEVLIEGYEAGKAMQTGEAPGLLRINHLIAQYLPGNGDNSVFNLLRMMPGIRAAGEPAGLTVWGSKPGESSVIFDGYRLFSMNGYNEQISSINPYMVKEIRLFKGGYGSAYDNQTGAIADITSIDGKRGVHDIKLNINNLTANAFVSVPAGKKITIMSAYRQTYYGLYDVNTLNPFGKRVANQPENSNATRNNTLYITPDYSFRDANFKISGETSRGDNYFLSLYGASDDFEYSLTGDDISLNAFEKNRQLSAGAEFNKVWKNSSVTRLALNYSNLDNSSEKALYLNRNRYDSINIHNIVTEAGASVVHTFSALGMDESELGIEPEVMKAINDGDTREVFKLGFYIQDRLIMNDLSIILGARADLFTSKVFIQPRLSLKYNISGKFSTSLSWGTYNQFLGKVPVIYEDKIPSLVWKILGDNEFPVTKSMHTVLNLTYTNKSWLLTLEGYNKKNTNLSRIYRRSNRNYIVNGESLITGVDLFSKWERRGSQVFSSFSIASSLEKFLTESNQSIWNTPMELKVGALWNLSPFYFSAEYVYGAGFTESYGMGRFSNIDEAVYNRMDLAATYTFKSRHVVFKTGVSVLNLFNSPNIKTLDIFPLAGGGAQSQFQNLYSESIPFTPTLFVHIEF